MGGACNHCTIHTPVYVLETPFHTCTHASLSSPPPPPPPPFPPTHTGVCFQHLTLPSDHLNREPLLSATAIQNGQDLSCCDGGCACTGEPCGTGRKGEVALTSGAAGEDHFEGIIQGREVKYKGNHILASLILRHPLRFPLLLVATFHLLAVSSPLCIMHNPFYYSDVTPMIKVSGRLLFFCISNWVDTRPHLCITRLTCICT